VCDGGKAAFYSFQKYRIVPKTSAQTDNYKFLVLGTLKRPILLLGFSERNQGLHKCADWKQEFSIENWQ
jgi:hypothetical protein